MDEKSKSNKYVSIVFIICFVALIVLPGLLLDRKTSISEEEHRYLTEFPAFVDASGQVNSQWKDGFADYLYDRIGLRRQFISTAAITKMEFLHISPNEIIHVGKDGWYFYTLQGGVEIARGEYFFTEDYLDVLLENHQAISDYYASKGCEYYFMPLPGKPTVYPEYLSGGKFSTRKTLIDQVNETLNERTTVNTIEVKESFINNKDKGQIFLKQDFHFDTLGSYLAYECILKKMNETGFMNGASPIPTSMVDANYGPGEVSGYLGNILTDEIAPDVTFTMNSRQITDGEYYDRIAEICYEAKSQGCTLDREIGILENPDAEYGTVLIYGDSQTMLERKLPQFLAEHFKTVVRVGNIPDIYGPLDDFVKPDVVIIESIERQISTLYTIPKH